jgi:hypothetical protein
MLETYLDCLELGFFEVGEAFKGLADENVWKRPPGGLLSVGELAGHIAYWEAVRMAGEDTTGGSKPDLAKCPIKSPLVDERFGYYSTTIDTAPSDMHLAMTAEQVHAELSRVHAESVAHLKALAPDLRSKAPWWFAGYDEYLKYAVFHVAYHTGQMYSARHLLGEIPPDN